ncbi:MAG: GNAT family N-acetyltransferase, partial [Clostridiales bacterium]|nr:GNAT family N-acetyltransferase [Clostridiales bacterium]
MRFILPSLEYEQKAKDFIREFYEYSSEINGTGGLDRFLREETYALWLEKVRSDLDIANTLPGKAAAYTYFYLREDDMKIIG